MYFMNAFIIQVRGLSTQFYLCIESSCKQFDQFYLRLCLCSSYYHYKVLCAHVSVPCTKPVSHLLPKMYRLQHIFTNYYINFPNSK